MRFPRELSPIILAAALMAPTLASPAEPPSQAEPTSAAAAQPPAAEPAPSSEPSAPAAPSDAEQYAAREAMDGTAATFEGGNSSLYISGGALTIVLLVVILVIVL